MWYRSLLSAARSRRHLFWHSAATHKSLDLERDVADSAEGAERIFFLDCRRVPLREDARDVDTDYLAGVEADVLFVYNFDHLLRIGRGKAWMRQLRVPVQLQAQAGTAVVVASDVPQHAFPAIDGSSIATDCYQFTMPTLRPNDVVTDAAYVATLIQASHGYIGVASRLLGAGFEQLGERQRTKTSGAMLREVIAATVCQCGADVLGWLEDGYLNRRRARLPLEDLDTRVFSTLLNAGLAAEDPASDFVELFAGLPRGIIVSALSDAEANTYDAPREWLAVASAVFSLERLCRRALTAHLEGHPHLAEPTLAIYSKKILANYLYETELKLDTVSDVVAPWNWVDLSDVISVCADLAEGATVAGLRSRMWRRMGEDVIRIRNRTQHMRLPMPGDAEALRSYIRVLKLKMEL